MKRTAPLIREIVLAASFQKTAVWRYPARVDRRISDAVSGEADIRSVGLDRAKHLVRLSVDGAGFVWARSVEVRCRRIITRGLFAPRTRRVEQQFLRFRSLGQFCVCRRRRARPQSRRGAPIAVTSASMAVRTSSQQSRLAGRRIARGRSSSRSLTTCHAWKVPADLPVKRDRAA